jgi:hypothetical protein
MYTLFICDSYHTKSKSFHSTDAAIAFFNQLEISAQNIDVAYIDSTKLEEPIVLLQTNQGA